MLLLLYMKCGLLLFSVSALVGIVVVSLCSYHLQRLLILYLLWFGYYFVLFSCSQSGFSLACIRVALGVLNCCSQTSTVLCHWITMCTYVHTCMQCTTKPPKYVSFPKNIEVLIPQMLHLMLIFRGTVASQVQEPLLFFSSFFLF